MADVAGSKVITEDELDSSSLENAIDDILGMQLHFIAWVYACFYEFINV